MSFGELVMRELNVTFATAAPGMLAPATVRRDEMYGRGRVRETLEACGFTSRAFRNAAPGADCSSRRNAVAMSERYLGNVFRECGV